MMVMPDFDVPEFAASTGLQQGVGWNDAYGPASSISSALREIDELPSSPVVAIDDELSFASLACLQGQLQMTAPPRLASELLAPLREVKSSDELEAIQRAADLISTAVDIASEVARPGMSERELKVEIERALWQGGADSVDYVLVQAGQAAAAPHHPTWRALDASSRAKLSFSTWPFRLMGTSLTSPNKCVSEPHPATTFEPTRQSLQLKKLAFKLLAWVQPSEASTGPVNRSSMTLVFPQSSVRAHGLGLSVHEPPSVVDSNDALLRFGMVLTIELGVYLEGRFGIRIEDTVLVSEQDPRRLTRGSRPLCGPHCH